jgi:hypothetical protein
VMRVSLFFLLLLLLLLLLLCLMKWCLSTHTYPSYLPASGCFHSSCAVFC